MQIKKILLGTVCSAAFASSVYGANPPLPPDFSAMPPLPDLPVASSNIPALPAPPAAATAEAAPVADSKKSSVAPAASNAFPELQLPDKSSELPNLRVPLPDKASDLPDLRQLPTLPGDKHTKTSDDTQSPFISPPSDASYWPRESRGT